MFHVPTKHIEVDMHFIREKVTNNDVYLKVVSSVEQVSNSFMRTSPLYVLHSLKEKAYVVFTPVCMRGVLTKRVLLCNFQVGTKIKIRIMASVGYQVEEDEGYTRCFPNEDVS